MQHLEKPLQLTGFFMDAYDLGLYCFHAIFFILYFIVYADAQIPVVVGECSYFMIVLYVFLVLFFIPLLCSVALGVPVILWEES